MTPKRQIWFPLTWHFRYPELRVAATHTRGSRCGRLPVLYRLRLFPSPTGSVTPLQDVACDPAITGPVIGETMGLVTGGRLRLAVAAPLLIVLSVSGLVVVLVTGVGSHLACPGTPGSPQSPHGVINLPLLICRQQQNWGWLVVGSAVGLVVGLVVVGGISLIDRARRPPGTSR
jgi:hypothetical protein